MPLNTATTYEKTKAFAHALAQRLEREHPDEVVSRMQKTLRKGKVLIDWSQNDEHKTTVNVYSLRAKASADGLDAGDLARKWKRSRRKRTRADWCSRAMRCSSEWRNKAICSRRC